MPTKMVSHEEQGSAKFLMFDWSGPTTYRYNSRYPDVATYLYIHISGADALVPRVQCKHTSTITY